MFEVAISDRPGHVVRRERPTRDYHVRPYVRGNKTDRTDTFPQGAARAVDVMVKQVGSAPGKPRTNLAFEAAVIDSLAGARIPSWPETLGGPVPEAGDSFPVRPASPQPNDNERRLEQYDRNEPPPGGA